MAICYTLNEVEALCSKRLPSNQREGRISLFINLHSDKVRVSGILPRSYYSHRECRR